MNKIPTAEEFLKNYENITDHYADQEYYEWKLIEALQEFAKLHVEAFRQNLLTNHLESWDDCEVTTKECVENSYPLENIK